MSANRQHDLPPCARHPDRPTGLRCVRCERPACPDCLREASVGYQCVDCVSEGAKSVRAPRTVSGARARPPGARSLVVVPSLIAVNVAAFIATAVQARSITENEGALFLHGMLIPDLIASGDWWRLFTSGFLHFGGYGGFGPVHLLFNMFALWVLGRDMEVALGRAWFLTVYLLSLVGGSTAVMLFGNPIGGVAGASGAVYGLFGGIAVIVFKRKLNPTPVLVLIGVNILLSVTLPGISLLGHLGGMVVGALATAALVYAPAARRRQFQVGACVALVVVMAVAIGVAVATLDGGCSMDAGGNLWCVRSQY
ncbi:rhomboid family intramembrane serine protease [Actinophytocola xinjiangensis]|uniref:Rhomboid family intramembrane serine protease n=1 Tax=Actinophytocola xinjiangensis TaxID=485602 RepID=A0A7Z0WFS4_9PSEU|nr:rhomboid family intramembrane serine protease [Actinophytocola xinjiangensis]OLF06301.1 rhomboid family intramembrane serine protease [Actinophytocola xinjiangensis]